MNPHQIALEAIKKNIVGDVEEISTKTPWGFHASIPLNNITAEEFFTAEPRIVGTRILHILRGEGLSENDFNAVFAKAVTESYRVIILEHNPYCESWRDDPIVSKVSRTDLEKKLGSPEILGPGDRNLLWYVDCEDGFHLPCLDKAKEAHTITPGVHPRYGLYTLTSETPMSDEDIDYLLSLEPDRTLYTVAGGCAFLGLISRVMFFKVAVFDICLPQLVYTRWRMTGNCGKLIDILPDEAAFDCFISSYEAENKPAGRWRLMDLEKYLPKIEYWLADIEWINENAEQGAVIYTSTVEPLPTFRDDLTVITALDPRDQPRITQRGK